MLSKKIIKLLEKDIGQKNIFTDANTLKKHSKDWSFHNSSLPDLVIFPKTTKDVSKTLKIANKYSIPVTCWGGGSSLEGNPIPVKGGIVLDMTKMNKILKIYKDDLQTKVQPGIIGDELNKKLKKYNLFFPAAPGSSHLATIGGMVANNAGGMNAIKYGVVGDWILELELVLTDGQIIRTGSRSVKSVSGYDLKRLFIGSEGTLGIITEIVLRLAPIPENKIAILVAFENISDTTKAVLEILKSNLNTAAIEYMDKAYIKYVNIAKNISLPEKPTLVIEFHGNKEINLLCLKKIIKICKNTKGIFYKEFKTTDELKLLWQYRRAVRPVLNKILPNKGVLSAEIGIPISEVENFLKKAEILSKKYKLETVMFGHIGDGNFHGWALYDLDNKKSWNQVEKLNEELINFAIKNDGTTTGEHGIGIGKRKFLAIEHPTSFYIMKKIKGLLDPKGILNPGKIFYE